MHTRLHKRIKDKRACLYGKGRYVPPAAEEEEEDEASFLKPPFCTLRTIKNAFPPSQLVKAEFIGCPGCVSFHAGEALIKPGRYMEAKEGGTRDAIRAAAKGKREENAEFAPRGKEGQTAAISPI